MQVRVTGKDDGSSGGEARPTNQSSLQTWARDFRVVVFALFSSLVIGLLVLLLFGFHSIALAGADAAEFPTIIALGRGSPRGAFLKSEPLFPCLTLRRLDFFALGVEVLAQFFYSVSVDSLVVGGESTVLACVC